MTKLELPLTSLVDTMQTHAIDEGIIARCQLAIEANTDKLRNC